MLPIPGSWETALWTPFKEVYQLPKFDFPSLSITVDTKICLSNIDQAVVTLSVPEGKGPSFSKTCIYVYKFDGCSLFITGDTKILSKSCDHVTMMSAATKGEWPLGSSSNLYLLSKSDDCSESITGDINICKIHLIYEPEDESAMIYP